MNISKNFTLEEFVRSGTATAYHIDNTPTLPIVWNICAMVALVLQPLRDELGESVIISSGYRCQELNSHPAVKGVSDSYHLTGRAADIHLKSNAYGAQVFDILKKNPYVDKVLYEHGTNSNWIHVQVSTSPRNYNNPNYLANK